MIAYTVAVLIGRAMIAYTVAVLIGCAMICLYSSGIYRMGYDLPIQKRY